jgi:hypothetical protein
MTQDAPRQVGGLDRRDQPEPTAAPPERSVLVILDGDELVVSAGDVNITLATRR